MNILTDELPEAVVIDGQEYDLNTDWRTCVKIILAFEDDDLVAIEKVSVLLGLLYPVRPVNGREAFAKGIKFLNGGKEESEDEGLPRLYSFAKDANLIFAAFRQTHGIDLETAKMHWWKFLALFMDLGSDTTFCNLVGLRKRYYSGKATKEERAAIRDLGDVFDVPQADTHSLEEKENKRMFDLLKVK